LRAQQLALFLQRQHAAVIGQRMDDNGGVLTRLDHLVEIADAAVTRGKGQRAVLPAGAVGIEEVSTYQIRGGHVLVAGDGDKRAVQTPGHMLHEAGLAATRRPFEHDRHPCFPGGLEQRDLLADRAIPGLGRDAVLGGGVGHVHGSPPLAWLARPRRDGPGRQTGVPRRTTMFAPWLWVKLS
jgi:hypothetical protein